MGLLLPAEMAVIAQSREQIEHAEQEADDAEYAAGIRICKEEQLRNRNDDKHQAHGDVHTGSIDAAKLGLLASSGPEAVKYREGQGNDD